MAGQCLEAGAWAILAGSCRHSVACSEMIASEVKEVHNIEFVDECEVSEFHADEDNA